MATAKRARNQKSAAAKDIRDRITDIEIARAIDRYEAADTSSDPVARQGAISGLVDLIRHWPEFLFVRGKWAYRWDGERLHIHGFNLIDCRIPPVRPELSPDWDAANAPVEYPPHIRHQMEKQGERS